MIDQIKIDALKKAHDTNLISPSQQHFFCTGVDKAIELAEQEFQTVMEHEEETMLYLIKYTISSFFHVPIEHAEVHVILDEFLNQ